MPTDARVSSQQWNATQLRGKIEIAHGFAFASQHFASQGTYKLTTPGHFFEAGGFRDIGEKQKYYVGPIPIGYVLQPGDVIVAMTEQAEGLLGSAAVVPQEHGYLHNQRLGRVKAISPEVEHEYLVYIFNSESYRSKVRETAVGTKVKHTSPEKLLEIPVRLPPPNEQRAIATALRDVDALLAQLDRLIAKKRDLKQAAMQQLLTGQIRLPGFGGSWKLKKLGEEIADLLAGVSVNSMVDDADAAFSGPAVLKTSAVVNGEFKPWEAKTIAAADMHRVQLTPVAETVLISRMNTPDLVGECGYVDADHPNLFVPDRLWMTRFRKSAQLSARWLAFLLCTPAARLLVKNIATGTSGSMKNISKTAFLNLEFNIPELDEQIAISVALADMHSEIAALEVQRDKTRTLKQAMMQELLTGRIRLI